MKDVLDIELQMFLRSILPEDDIVMADLRHYAEENHIPIVDPEVGNLLGFMVKLLQPEQILEIGTAIGCSTIHMARAMGDTGHITTLELTEERHAKALGYFQRAGLDSRITALQGDARELVPELAAKGESYDMIFMDAAKGQYHEFLVAADKMLKPGGLLIADNVLLNGWVVDLQYPRHRQKTMVLRMRDFLESFKTSDRFDCTLIPLGDGVAMIQKKADRKAVQES